MKYIEKELDDLKNEVLSMWAMVYSQLNRAGEAMLSLDKDLAREVILREKRVNAFELKIDSSLHSRCRRSPICTGHAKNKHEP